MLTKMKFPKIKFTAAMHRRAFLLAVDHFSVYSVVKVLLYTRYYNIRTYFHCNFYNYVFIKRININMESVFKTNLNFIL